MKRLLIPFLAVFVFAGCISIGDSEDTRDVVFNTSSGEHTYKVEVADNKEERSLGLMHRESMAQDRGMIFIYEENLKPAFWMKNTLISLDMIFLNKDLEVVDYFENVPPCEADPCPHYIPNSNSMYIIELNAGQANKMLLTRGDLVQFN